MKKIGLIYGVNLMVDTDDEAIAKNAENWFENLEKDSRELLEIKTTKELTKFLNPFIK